MIKKVNESLALEEIKGNIIFTQNFKNIEKVLSTFKESNKIYIFTYSMTEEMLKYLNQIPSWAEVHLVVNNLTLELGLLEKILPDEFKFRMTLYLCPINHSKIIATDKLCYIGSANFGSYFKFEAGMVLESNSLLSEKLHGYLENLMNYSTYIKGPELNLEYETVMKPIINDEMLEEEVTKRVWGNIENSIHEIKEVISKLENTLNKGNYLLYFIIYIKKIVINIIEYDERTWEIDTGISGDLEKLLNQEIKRRDLLINEVEELEELILDKEEQINGLESLDFEEENPNSILSENQAKIAEFDLKILEAKLDIIQDELSEKFEGLDEESIILLERLVQLLEDFNEQDRDRIRSSLNNAVVEDEVEVWSMVQEYNLLELGKFVSETEMNLFRKRLGKQSEFLKSKYK
ncbi:hypothetical protein ACPOM7_18415 [Peribacillus castrilensis]|uniref:PLD phosphodiesterase domain-containing protein n=2 Tax=Peribacillus TaxID=2675229 RepID=A0AAN2TTQ1_9BACI|nr:MULTISPECIES: hypothetical protein [Bacillaceae]MCF7621998.1 hypothetical protein [Peribacillus frigoritolerans]MCP1156117.1 hypothetical protein [Peribacillus frigoritolerans]MCT1390705.1 hypothetical protein [Peribacillus frigoritolerans]PRA86360.1 hypothetical protein CQ056_15310 [Peribacillus simplex]CEG33236.1 hypothetical protein BN1180_03408 [Peribacillus simplex]